MCSGPVGHRFEIEADPLADALMRVLGPFAVQQVTLACVRHDQTDAGARTMLETTVLDAAKADLLGLRLAQLPCVRRVVVQPIEIALAAA
jgi:acetolactate synthase regulatory subunit